MILYKSKFLEVNYLELQHITHFVFSEYAAYMDTEGIYHEMLNFLGQRIHKRSRLFYLDLQKTDHLIEPEFFGWFEQYILPKLASFNARKLAYLTGLNPDQHPENHIYTLPSGKDLEVRFFRQPQKLMQWLTESIPTNDA